MKNHVEVVFRERKVASCTACSGNGRCKLVEFRPQLSLPEPACLAEGAVVMRVVQLQKLQNRHHAFPTEMSAVNLAIRYKRLKQVAHVGPHLQLYSCRAVDKCVSQAGDAQNRERAGEASAEP
eukprot:1481854-Prymnesium_polylepis.1